MKARILPVALCTALLSAGALLAEDTDRKSDSQAPAPAPASPAPDAVPGRQANPPAAATPPAPSPSATPAPSSLPPPAPTAKTDNADKTGKSDKTTAAAPAPKDSAAKSTATNPATPAPPSPTVLPQIEVRRDRLSKLNLDIQDLEKELEREKKKLKPTETDEALNNSKVTSAFSLFGGSSADARAQLAGERVSMMESELDLMQTMIRAKTQKEYDDLQIQLDEMRTMRRELDLDAKPEGPSR
jgi:hypothetical protein